MRDGVKDVSTDRCGPFAGDDPFALAREWLRNAEATEPNDPNAMALATVDGDGTPNVRIVLLKEIEDGPDGGFVFYTNFEGRKGTELLARPRAACVIHWKTMKRQVRLRGDVDVVEDSKADAYYASRGVASRLGAWASAQSRPLASRQELMDRFAAVRRTHGDDPPRPPHWGGFRLRPFEVEFWADGADRLHDRFRWSRAASGWIVSRLHP
ncbi:pyridoxamine 5'-phosphate oxidase [Jannaschia sp. LMIT008]|uniref:pyridoxamine 5'-phosphate oxidase n=1 Tax=Jannaschia maritima TaxID=3032585 RepID=UPI00281102A2|nr:pyridoxamine 5'-phosphate oxidase [Jannaschia sp. LMIT008]